jgi:exodeoxyribonuclease VII large subunit
MVYVEGEISNFANPSSGHWYFTLKDTKSQLRCAMFRNRNQRLRFVPRNGLQIMVRGKVSLYEGRGEFQLIAEHMEEAGDGALRQAFEKLKTDLQREGLFDSGTKKPIPSMPEHIGIITSATGAAVHDVITVMQRRFPAINLSIIPVQVQGDISASLIADALQFANQYHADPFDVILLTRGGGSLEDLWSFNTETVARAIYNSEIPVVSAVGHESDVTIADFVADLRAPTPSAAAEILTPDGNEWAANLIRIESKLIDQTISVIENHQSHLRHVTRRLRHPGQRLQDLGQRLDDLEIRLKNNFRYQLSALNIDEVQSRLNMAISHSLERYRSQLQLLSAGITSPLARIESAEAKTKGLANNMNRLYKHRVENKEASFQTLIQRLNTLSPLSTLDRGYAIVTTEEERIIKKASEMKVGSTIWARLAEGRLTAEVTEVEETSAQQKQADEIQLEEKR